MNNYQNRPPNIGEIVVDIVRYPETINRESHQYYIYQQQIVQEVY